MKLVGYSTPETPVAKCSSEGLGGVHCRPFHVGQHPSVAQFDAVGAVGYHGVVTQVADEQQALEEPFGVDHVVVDGGNADACACNVAELVPVFGVGAVVAVGTADLEPAVDQSLQADGQRGVVVVFVEPQDDGGLGVAARDGFKSEMHLVQALTVGGERDDHVSVLGNARSAQSVGNG